MAGVIITTNVFKAIFKFSYNNYTVNVNRLFHRSCASHIKSAADPLNYCNDTFISAIPKNKLPSQVSQKSLTERYNALIETGINQEDIIKQPELLLNLPSTIRNRRQTLIDLKIDEKALLPALTFQSGLFYKFVTRCNHDSRRHKEHRIRHLSKVLNISDPEVCHLVQKYQFLLTISYVQLLHIIEVLIQHRIKPEDILRDPWVLRCTTDSVLNRFIRLEKAEVVKVKPWMVRCTDELITAYIQRATSKQKLLGESSLEEYLSERLGCSAQEMQELMQERELQKTSILKMKRMLDFLFSSGFSSAQIISGLPRVANRRIETIYARILELNQSQIPPSLYVLCKSKKEFVHYVKKWKNRDK